MAVEASEALVRLIPVSICCNSTRGNNNNNNNLLQEHTTKLRKPKRLLRKFYEIFSKLSFRMNRWVEKEQELWANRGETEYPEFLVAYNSSSRFSPTLMQSPRQSCSCQPILWINHARVIRLSGPYPNARWWSTAGNSKNALVWYRSSLDKIPTKLRVSEWYTDAPTILSFASPLILVLSIVFLAVLLKHILELVSCKHASFGNNNSNSIRNNHNTYNKNNINDNNIVIIVLASIMVARLSGKHERETTVHASGSVAFVAPETTATTTAAVAPAQASALSSQHHLRNVAALAWLVRWLASRRAAQ